MGDDPNNQDAPAVDTPADNSADAPELSLTDELSAARESDSETPVEEDTPQPTPSEEPKPKEPTDKPADPAEVETPSDTPADQDVPADKPEETAEERARRFYEIRQQQRARDQQDVAQRLNEHYQPQAADDLKQQYLDKGYDDFQAEMLADRDRNQQATQIAEARAQLVELNANINQQALQVMHDFPEFDPDSKSYDQEFANKARELYVNASNTMTDEKSGVVLQTNVLPYDFYKQLHDLRDAGLSQAQIKAQQNAETQLASIAPSSSSPPAPSAPSGDDAQAQALENAFKNV